MLSTHTGNFYAVGLYFYAMSAHTRRMTTAPNTPMPEPIDDELDAFNRRLRGMMASHGVTQAMLGKWLDLNQANVSKRLRGQTRWTLDQMVQLSQAMGKSMAILFGAIDDDPLGPAVVPVIEFYWRGRGPDGGVRSGTTPG